MAVDPSGFREIVLSTTTKYPIPFLTALFLAFITLSLAGALYAGAPWWLPAIFAAVAGLFALGMVTWTLLRRPDLLRSERHEVAQRAIDLIGGDNLTPERINEIGLLLSDEPSKKTKTRGS